MRDVLNIPERFSQAFVGYIKLTVKVSKSWRKRGGERPHYRQYSMEAMGTFPSF